MAHVEYKIKTRAEAILKCSYYKREKQQISGKRIEPVWMTGELRRQIPLRREFNRRRINATEEHVDQCRTRYQEQKEKVRSLIVVEKCKHEKRITGEIKQAKANGRKM